MIGGKKVTTFNLNWETVCGYEHAETSEGHKLRLCIYHVSSCVFDTQSFIKLELLTREAGWVVLHSEEYKGRDEVYSTQRYEDARETSKVYADFLYASRP